MLRNPSKTLNTWGFLLPGNVYEIDTVKVMPKAESTDVKVSLRLYTDATKAESPSETVHLLVGLTSDRSALTPALYQEQLLIQHANEVVDGTKLSNFEVLL